MINEAQAAAIRERVERATPEPWEHRMASFDEVGFVSAPPASTEDPYNIEILGDDDTLYPTKAADCEFIAHARTDVPALLDSLAECKRLLGSVYPYIQHHWEIPAALFEEVKAVVK